MHAIILFSNAKLDSCGAHTLPVNSVSTVPVKNLTSILAFTQITPCKGIQIPESGKIFLVECGILGFGIRNTAEGIRNTTNEWNPGVNQ